jgi:hypothetical protein
MTQAACIYQRERSEFGNVPEFGNLTDNSQTTDGRRTRVFFASDCLGGGVGLADLRTTAGPFFVNTCNFTMMDFRTAGRRTSGRSPPNFELAIVKSEEMLNGDYSNYSWLVLQLVMKFVYQNVRGQRSSITFLLHPSRHKSPQGCRKITECKLYSSHVCNIIICLYICTFTVCSLSPGMVVSVVLYGTCIFPNIL